MSVLIAAVLTAALAVAWRWSRRGSGDADRGLPGLATDLARSVRAGATLRVALGDAARTAPPPWRVELAGVLDRVERGTPLDGALDAWRRREDRPGVDLLVGACRFGDAHGGDLARALDGAAAALLDAVEVVDEVRALTAQARTSALVLVALPPVGATVLAVVDAGVARTLFGTPAGWACLAVGLTLDAAGLLLADRLVRRALG